MSTKKQEKLSIALQPSHVRVYNFIETFIEKNIFAPELNETAKAVKLSIRQTYNLINELVSLGYLEKVARKKRGLKIIKKLG